MRTAVQVPQHREVHRTHRSDEDVLISQDDVASFLKSGFMWATLIALVAGSATYWYQSRMAPVFEAVTTLYAADNVIDLRSMGLSYLVSPALHVDAYEVAVQSDQVLRPALTFMGIAQPTLADVEALRSNVELRSDETSRLLQVVAVGLSPSEAADRSEAIGRALVAWDAMRPRENLMRITESLRSRIAVVDNQVAASVPGPQQDSLAALRAEQMSQLATAEMLAESVVGRLEIVRPPAIPEAPVSPSPIFNAILVGLVAMAFVYVIRLMVVVFDGRIRDSQRASVVTGLPVLAAFPPIPRLGARDVSPVQMGLLRSALIPKPASSTSILLAGAGRANRSSRVALALAESFARTGRRVLLISTVPRDSDILDRLATRSQDDKALEAHLREPDSHVISSYVRVDAATTVSVLLAGEGATDNSEKLARGLEAALRSWSKEFSVIVIATPEILRSADAVTVAPLVQDTVIVADSSAKRPEIAHAVNLLSQRGIHVQGIVLVGAGALSR